MKPEIYFYNTLTREKEIFKPLKDDFVRIYDCGPTVYWYAHIGNMWRFVVSDLVRRVLEYNGYKVRQVMNITDVGHLTEEDLAGDTGEDKIEVSARREKKTPQEIAEFYTKAFLEDLDRLNIQRPHVMPKATEHIQDMIKLIKRLEKKEFTYRAGNYLCFDISKFSGYGKLSGQNLEGLRAGARLEPVPNKRNPFDFALWISDSHHLQKWDSPWGVGYPGWHIECSTMAMKYLGEQLDIHSGGEDNIFPHHENEIAQSESATGKQFVRCWIHVRHNLIEGKKMSKSLGNVFTIQDLVERGFDPLAYRYLCLTVHYRSKFNFTFEGLQAAQTALNRLREFMAAASSASGETSKVRGKVFPATDFSLRFLEAVNDDLNMPKAIALVWDLVKSDYPSAAKHATLLGWDKVLGLRLDQPFIPAKEILLEDLPAEVARLVERREGLRREEKFEEADELRKKIIEMGFTVEDTPEGPRLFKLG